MIFQKIYLNLINDLGVSCKFIQAVRASVKSHFLNFKKLTIMKHEKIFKREDGTKVNISVNFWVDSIGDKFTYRVSVSTCEPKKRIFKYVNDIDDYTWRRLNTEQRAECTMNRNLEHVTKEEIQEVVIELWEQMKPSF